MLRGGKKSQYHYLIFLTISRAAQTHHAGHRRSTGLVFETPDLDIIAIPYQDHCNRVILNVDRKKMVHLNKHTTSQRNCKHCLMDFLMPSGFAELDKSALCGTPKKLVKNRWCKTDFCRSSIISNEGTNDHQNVESFTSFFPTLLDIFCFVIY